MPGESRRVYVRTGIRRSSLEMEGGCFNREVCLEVKLREANGKRMGPRPIEPLHTKASWISIHIPY